MRYRLTCLAIANAVALAVAVGSASAATHVYVTAWDNQLIDSYNTGPNGGLTTLIADHGAGGLEPWYMVMTSNARNLYLTSFGGHKIEAFTVLANGVPVHKDAAHGGELQAGNQPVGIALSPDNRNAYVVNYNGAGPSSVSIYDIAADGSIKAHTPDSVPAGAGPYGVAVSRDGKSVYTADQDNNIYQFNRGPTGSLTPKTPGFVRPKGLSPTPDWLSLTPDGKHLYSANYDDGTIGIFNVAPNGALTEQGASPVSTGASVYEMAMSPNGKSLYAASNSDGNVYPYSIGVDGFLHPKSPPTVHAGVGLDGIWLSPNGKSAYVANGGTYPPSTHQDFSVAQFNVGLTGLLTPKNPASIKPDDYPAGIAVTPDQGPNALFTFSKKRGLKEKLNGSVSKDPDSKITRYVWSFGDGKSGTGAKPKHTYKKPGKYKVTLTVFDDASCSTALVWTGQMAYCSGSQRATITHTVKIRKVKKKP